MESLSVVHWIRCRFASRMYLVGNLEGEAGLEITALGPTLRFTSDSVVALVGADFKVDINGSEARTWEAVRSLGGLGI